MGEVGKQKCVVEEGNQRRRSYREKRRELLLSRSIDNSPADLTQCINGVSVVTSEKY